MKIESAASGEIASRSRGTPRLANILANKSLMLACGEGVPRIERRHVAAAVADTPSASTVVGTQRWIALGVGLACAVAGISWMLVR